MVPSRKSDADTTRIACNVTVKSNLTYGSKIDHGSRRGARSTPGHPLWTWAATADADGRTYLVASADRLQRVRGAKAMCISATAWALRQHRPIGVKFVRGSKVLPPEK